MEVRNVGNATATAAPPASPAPSPKQPKPSPNPVDTASVSLRLQKELMSLMISNTPELRTFELVQFNREE